MKLRITYCLFLQSILGSFLMANAFAVIQTDPEVSFKNEIRPIFQNYCLRCHGEETEEGFRIDEKEAALDYIVPGEPEESEIYTYLVTDDEEELMPPADEGGPLDDADIQLVKLWIAQGASWPDDVEWNLPAEPSIDVSDAGASSGLAGDSGEQVVVSADEINVWNAIGSLHPAMIHLPIGLLFASGLFAFLSLRGSFVMSDCAYYCLWLGTLGAILACVTGWWFAPMENSAWQVESFDDLTNTDSRIFWHRTTGLLVTGAALLVSLFAAGARNRDPDDGVLWKLGAMILALGIGYVGHEGGELTWNRDGKHYQDLDRVIEKYVPIFSTESSDEDKSSSKVKEPSSKSVETKGEAGVSDKTDFEKTAIGQTSEETRPASPGGSQAQPEIQK